MKNKIIALVVFVLISGFLFAKHVPIDQARSAAKNFYFASSPVTTLKYSDINISNEFSISYQGEIVFHVFNISDNNGYLILSADDQASPVLSYSFTGSFDNNEQKLPPAYLWWLSSYKKQIKYIVENNIKNNEATVVWDSYTKNFKGTKEVTAVLPLLDPIAWNQSQYYNDLCPADTASGYGYGGHCPSGCVSIAMAQTMKFWAYPPTGLGQNTYNHATYGNQTANFGATTYNWANMPASVSAVNNDVATIIYHSGVSVNMDYGPDGSGSSTSHARDALVNNFRYSTDALHANKSSYTDPQWIALLKGDLDIGRPVIYHGTDATQGGHAFICDGYDATNKFHFNWGWGGSGNSYNFLNSLVPGPGTGTYNFIQSQGAVFHIHPASDYYPVADFTSDTTLIVVGDTVIFTDLSTTPTGTAITSRHWYFPFGTPGTSTALSPVVSYNAIGTYNVSLAVYNAQGSDSITKTEYIRVITPSVVRTDPNFVADRCNILVGDSINFTDQTQGDPLFWHWKFYGGTPSSSTAQNPTFIKYTTAGNYKVTLITTNTLGSDSMVKDHYIHVQLNAGTAIPIADFNARSRLITTGQSVSFTDSSLNFPIQWQWTFTGGTPGTSALQNPTDIVYDTTGFYPVRLCATNPNGTSCLTKTEYILVTSAPILSYCDTIGNILATEGIYEKKVTPWGYLAGANSKKITYYADKYTNYTFGQVSALKFPVARSNAFSPHSTTKIEFCVWNEALDGSVGTQIGTVKEYIDSLPFNYYKVVYFDTPVPVDGAFFIGFKVCSYTAQQDTFSLYIAHDRGASGLNTLWVKTTTAGWQTCKQFLNISTSLMMEPIMCLVDVPKTESDNTVLVFPNPAADFVIIDFGDDDAMNIQVNIFDLMGKHVRIDKPEVMGNQVKIETMNLSTGMYFLNIKMGNKIVSKKISVIR